MKEERISDARWNIIAGDFINCREFQTDLFMKKTLSLAVMAAATLFLAGCTSGSKYVIEGSGDQLVDGHWVFLETELTGRYWIRR